MGLVDGRGADGRTTKTDDMREGLAQGGSKQETPELEDPGQAEEQNSCASPVLLVRREWLLERLTIGGSDVGITVVCAPEGFGKTALLLQYMAMVRGDPTRGAGRLIDARSRSADELGHELRACAEELEPRLRPLLAVDDVPAFEDERLQQLVILLRALRDQGFELVVTCTPANSALVNALGDAAKIGAQQLTVQPREYSEWTRAFSISSALDVYGLTQGVPALVVHLRQLTGSQTGREGLDQAIKRLYAGALEPLRRSRDPLYRLCCLFLLLGHGSMRDFERAGLRVRKEQLTRIARDYPIFGFNSETRAFCCLGAEDGALSSLRRDIARRRPSFVLQALRMLLRANRVDEAVQRCERLLDTAASVEIISQFPTRFILSGNALFVHEVASRLSGEDMAKAPIGLVLAVYLGSLTMGEYRLARTMCAALRHRANEIQGAVDEQTWDIARALSAVWGNMNGIELPALSEAFERAATTGPAVLLRSHVRIYRDLVGCDGNVAPSLYPREAERPTDNEIDLAELLIFCDRLMDDSLHRAGAEPVVRDEELESLVRVLGERHLVPFALRVRLAAALHRLLLGERIVDERVFDEVGKAAVRELDLPTQLLCMVGDGWRDISTNQLVSAQFRAQQVARHSDEAQVFLRDWAMVLERVAFVLNTSQLGIREEAERVELSRDEASPAQAWVVALLLSAARFDSELSAWYSLHKEALLDGSFCPIARLAMHAVGERAEPIRRLLPRSAAARYRVGDEPEPFHEGLFDVSGDSGFASIGQVSIRLFGGFRVERNGHVVTDQVWHRKKASVLAARLSLTLGAFVSRRTLTEELWPKLDYRRARENLYVTISTLRTALGQQSDGPQYVLTQGESIALNAEFIQADTATFDLLAREILLRRNGVTGRQVVESCLKMEQLYTGPLYVPDSGGLIIFARTQNIYKMRFVDCMLRGAAAALEIDDLHSAAWLAEAAQRSTPAREDVVRMMMRVYDRCGRRRELVDLYNSHLYYLEHELQAVPEEETRKTYEEIIQRARLACLV